MVPGVEGSSPFTHPTKDEGLGDDPDPSSTFPHRGVAKR